MLGARVGMRAEQVRARGSGCEQSHRMAMLGGETADAVCKVRRSGDTTMSSAICTNSRQLSGNHTMFMASSRCWVSQHGCAHPATAGPTRRLGGGELTSKGS